MMDQTCFEQHSKALSGGGNPQDPFSAGDGTNPVKTRESKPYTRKRSSRSLSVAKASSPSSTRGQFQKSASSVSLLSSSSSSKTKEEGDAAASAAAATAGTTTRSKRRGSSREPLRRQRSSSLPSSSSRSKLQQAAESLAAEDAFLTTTTTPPVMIAPVRSPNAADDLERLGKAQDRIQGMFTEQRKKEQSLRRTKESQQQERRSHSKAPRRKSKQQEGNLVPSISSEVSTSASTRSSMEDQFSTSSSSVSSSSGFQVVVNHHHHHKHDHHHHKHRHSHHHHHQNQRHSIASGSPLDHHDGSESNHDPEVLVLTAPSTPKATPNNFAKDFPRSAFESKYLVGTPTSVLPRGCMTPRGSISNVSTASEPPRPSLNQNAFWTEIAPPTPITPQQRRRASSSRNLLAESSMTETHHTQQQRRRSTSARSLVPEESTKTKKSPKKKSSSKEKVVQKTGLAHALLPFEPSKDGFDDDNCSKWSSMEPVSPQKLALFPAPSQPSTPLSSKKAQLSPQPPPPPASPIASSELLSSSLVTPTKKTSKTMNKDSVRSSTGGTKTHSRGRSSSKVEGAQRSSEQSREQSRGASVTKDTRRRSSSAKGLKKPKDDAEESSTAGLISGSAASATDTSTTGAALEPFLAFKTGKAPRRGSAVSPAAYVKAARQGYTNLENEQRSQRMKMYKKKHFHRKSNSSINSNTSSTCGESLSLRSEDPELIFQL
ncbi:hypothetical protein ACA910_016143 [Epithemia clementina (nom. ined.)]